MNPTLKTVLTVREAIIKRFKRHETAFLLVVKFLVGAVIFSQIIKIEMYRPEFSQVFAAFDGFLAVMLLAVFFAILPPTLANFMMLVTIVLQISQSIEVAAVVFLLGVCVLLFYCRLDPKRSFLIIAVVLGFYFKMPYAVVLFAGLYAGLGSIIPVTIGTAVWFFIPTFNQLVKSVVSPEVIEISELSSITDSLSDIYTTVHTQATGDLVWIYNAFIFAMIIVLIFAVSRLSVAYAKEIAVILGGVVCVFGYFMASVAAGIKTNMGGIFAWTLLSVIVVLIIRFFDIVLDYKKVEYVQFEDEENYYYVKIVNKMTITPAPAAAPAEERTERVRKPVSYPEDELLEAAARSRLDKSRSERTEPKPKPKIRGIRFK